MLLVAPALDWVGLGFVGGAGPDEEGETVTLVSASKGQFSITVAGVPFFSPLRYVTEAPGLGKTIYEVYSELAKSSAMRELKLLPVSDSASPDDPITHIHVLRRDASTIGKGVGAEERRTRE